MKHPWGWAIRDCGKRIENRKWRPEPRVIGQWVALHGGAIPKGKDYLEALADLQWITNRKLGPAVNLSATFIPGVFAVCTFGDPVKESEDPWFFGPWGWPITQLVALPAPVPCKGQLGLWELPEDVLGEVRRQYREATRCPDPGP